MATAAAKKAAAEAGTAKDYVVTSPLDHDGERYEIGDEVSLTDAQAAPLMSHTVRPKKGATEPAKA